MKFVLNDLGVLGTGSLWQRKSKLWGPTSQSWAARDLLKPKGLSGPSCGSTRCSGSAPPRLDGGTIGWIRVWEWHRKGKSSSGANRRWIFHDFFFDLQKLEDFCIDCRRLAMTSSFKVVLLPCRRRFWKVESSEWKIFSKGFLYSELLARLARLWTSPDWS